MAERVEPKPIGNVWKIAGAGTAAICVAAALEFAQSSSNTLEAIRAVLTLGGALTIGIALYLRPGHVSLYVLACLSAIIARFGFPQDWDSGHTAAGLASVIAGIGAVITALPVGYRKVAASVLMLLHFGGICVSVTSPGAQPWTSGAAGALFYRPYLQSVYLTNAYHFYSPEPGPASQVWFCIRYEKDSNGNYSQKWFKFPRRPDDITDPLGISYYRRLSLTMNLETADQMPVTDGMKRARIIAAQRKDGIPIKPEMLPLDTQFHMPSIAVRDYILPSYVRHIAKLPMLQHPDGLPIHSVRVYLVIHNVLRPADLEWGANPYDPTTYLPFYFGDFSSDGKLQNAGDPLLYWLIPIIRRPKDETVKPWHTVKTHPSEFVLIDGVKLHNGNVEHDMAREWNPDEDKNQAPAKVK
jgi:hypothetical protein